MGPQRTSPFLSSPSECKVFQQLVDNKSECAGALIAKLSRGFMEVGRGRGGNCSVMTAAELMDSK